MNLRNEGEPGERQNLKLKKSLSESLFPFPLSTLYWADPLCRSKRRGNSDYTKLQQSQMSRHQPVYLEKVVYNLRGGFLVRPLSIALVLGFTGAILSSLEERYPALSELVPSVLFPSRFDHQVSQTILSTIAQSVMTVVSIVFAILLMTLTLASMQFSPRILVSFTKDRITQWTLGLFLGTFSYCISGFACRPLASEIVLSGAHRLGRDAPCFGVRGASAFFHSPHFAVHQRELHRRPNRHRDGGDPQRNDAKASGKFAPMASGRHSRTDRWGSRGEYDVGIYSTYRGRTSSMRCATTNRVTITVIRRVGHFVPAGVQLVSVANPDKLTSSISKEIIGCYDIGPTRTLQQDIEFGVLQIVDIALRAISPAVNDPSTAISCIDQLSRILIQFASREPVPHRFYNPPGKLRLSLPVLGLDRLVHSAFDQIRVYSKGDAAVSLRMLRALTDVSITIEEAETRKMLAKMGRRILTGCEATLADDELREIRQRMLGLDKLALSITS